MSRRRPSLLWAALLAATVCRPAAAVDPDRASAVELARRWLEAEEPSRRAAITAKLAAHDGQWQAVVDGLDERPSAAVEPGYYPKEHFSHPQLRARRPEDLLYIHVPPGYRPRQAAGLIVFMHGGGRGSARTNPESYFAPVASGTIPGKSQIADLLLATGMIAVAPSAPWNDQSDARWCLPESDDYLADAILECKHRFNIDPDRVILMGQSMGGFGAVHQVQRQPDRFAAVIACAGAWALGYWPVIRGTPLFLVHGVRDAQEGVRRHDTDVQYARWAHTLLAAQGIEHVYEEHAGGHHMIDARPSLAKILPAAVALRRDPYCPQIALASPTGFTRGAARPVQHNRWLTLDEAVAGTIEYDELSGKPGERFDDWKLEHARRQRPGAAIEARLCGDNRIHATAQNVRRLTIWLHPRMVDFARPVTIEVNGRRRFHDRIRPSLTAALESYARRSDAGLVYPARVTLDVPQETPRDKAPAQVKGN